MCGDRDDEASHKALHPTRSRRGRDVRADSGARAAPFFLGSTYRARMCATAYSTSCGVDRWGDIVRDALGVPALAWSSSTGDDGRNMT